MIASCVQYILFMYYLTRDALISSFVVYIALIYFSVFILFVIYRICPTPDCGYPMYGSKNDPMSRCPKCTKKFCFNCGTDEWHTEYECKQYRSWKSNSNEIGDFRKWAMKNKCKTCPNCRTTIQKDGGCNHMTCTNCKHEFHWLTGHKWQGYNHVYGEPIFTGDNDDYDDVPIMMNGIFCDFSEFAIDNDLYRLETGNGNVHKGRDYIETYQPRRERFSNNNTEIRDENNNADNIEENEIPRDGHISRLNGNNRIGNNNRVNNPEQKPWPLDISYDSLPGTPPGDCEIAIHIGDITETEVYNCHSSLNASDSSDSDVSHQSHRSSVSSAGTINGNNHSNRSDKSKVDKKSKTNEKIKNKKKSSGSYKCSAKRRKRNKRKKTRACKKNTNKNKQMYHRKSSRSSVSSKSIRMSSLSSFGSFNNSPRRRKRKRNGRTKQKRKNKKRNKQQRKMSSDSNETTSSDNHEQNNRHRKKRKHMQYPKFKKGKRSDKNRSKRDGKCEKGRKRKNKQRK